MTVPFDIARFLDDELAGRATRLLDEIHLIAMAYHWSEAAILALPTVIMVFMFGQSRVFFAMARDGLLPRRLATVGKRGVPTSVTILTGVISAIIAGVMPLSRLAWCESLGPSRRLSEP